MKIDIITIFPEMFESIFKSGIISQGIKRKLVEINVVNLRDYAHDKHKQVDDRPLGGGPGMVLKPEPIFEAIEDLRTQKSYVIFLTPQGKQFTQKRAESLSKKKHIIIICGRYEGIDQRIRDKLVDYEISIGNYVLSGGEIPAMVVVDSVARLIPGVIKNENFIKSESFSEPNDRTKLDFPQYTRPANYKGMKVPEILLTGDHKRIQEWRENHRKKSK